MSQYLVKTYTSEGKFDLEVYTEKALFELLDLEGGKDKADRSKIAVYKLEDCIIDWS